MSVTSLFLPSVVEEVVSPINGAIQVVQAGNQYKIMAGGLIQSGGVLQDIWMKGLGDVSNYRFPVARVLFLGLGGGTAARLVAKLWPQARMTGVEIDPAMIRLGKKYFYGDELGELTIVQADAITWVKHQSDTYDLILVDIFLGEIIPKLTEGPEFLQDIQAILATPGKVIFNRLFYNHHREATQHFVDKVEKKFKEIELVRAWSNLLIIASNKTREESKLALKR